MNSPEKNNQLNEIASEIKAYRGLDIAKNCTRAVPGEGNADAEIMFIGEAPGFHEDREGRPFVGQAGKLLEKTLKDILGISRSEVYITNIVKYRPPENRDPLPYEIEACASWLDRQITVIQPKIICTLGRFSLAKFIPDISISRVHGQIRRVKFSDFEVLVFPMYHPAAALRSGLMMREFISDFNKLKSLLNPSPDKPPEVTSSTPQTQIQGSLF